MTQKNHRTWNTTAKRLAFWAAVVGILLLLPLVFNFPWTLFDYIFAGTVLFGAAAIYELITRTLGNKMQRIIVGAGILMAVMLVWAWAVA